MARQRSIEVTSHVARDFLQNAAYFNTMSKVVWEYVANSLDAVKDDEKEIQKKILQKRFSRRQRSEKDW